MDSLGGHTSEEQAILLEFLDFSCFLTVIHAMMWEMPRRQILLEGSFSIARSYHFISKGIKVLFLFGVSFKASFQLVELSLLFSYIQTYIHTKHSLSEEILESRLLMDSGMFFGIEGGWLDFLCT